MRHEAAQVAAVCIRGIADLCLPDLEAES